MKRYFLVMAMLFAGLSLQAQDPNFFDYQKINRWFTRLELNNVVLVTDTLIEKYPRSGDMYFNRALAEYYLNDQTAANNDFRLAVKFGYKKDADFIRWRTSLSYRVRTLVDVYTDYNTLDTLNGFKQRFGRKDSLQGALRPQRTCYDVYFYDLTLKIIPKSKAIEGSNLIYFKTLSPTRQIQIDLFDDLTLTSITWKGKTLKFTRVDNAVFVDFPEMLPQGEDQVVAVSYKGKPVESKTPPWDGGFVWKKNQGDWWIGVACEHMGASSWWPCKDHLSDKPDSMRINVQVPEGYQAVANGNLRSTRPIKNKYTNFEWFVSYPINSYNATFYMGKFINFSETYTNAQGTYPFDFYVLAKNLDLAQNYYRQTKDIVRVYEKLYGEYPYTKDGLAMVEAPYAGMEHQSAIAIGDEYGKKKRRNYEVMDYDYLLVHETAHEWWGNAIAVGDMADIWLSEGFATYSEQLFMEQKYGYDEYLKLVTKNMESVENIWPVVGPRDVNANTFLGGDVYNKGAAMLHNLRCEMNNDTLFFSMIKGFFSAFKYKISDTQDFITFVNQTTGKDYTDFFNKFLYETEPPVLLYSYTLKNNNLVFTNQWTGVGKNFSMPFGLVLNGDKSIRLEGSSEKQTYEAADLKTFYIPNEFRYDKNIYQRNSFTYFWTRWLK